MSYDAERWARSQKVGNASAKFVLIELANALNRETGKCYPSIEALQEATELNRKTVIAATKHLEEKGFITKRRSFVNGKQIVYYGFPSFKPVDWESKNKSTKTGTLESTENVTLPPQSTEIGTLESTENGTTESTKNGTDDSTEIGTYESTVFGTVTRNKNKEKNKEIEQGIETHEDAASGSTPPKARAKKGEAWKKWIKVEKPAEVPDDLWKQFGEIRALKKMALTERALELLRTEGEKAHMTLLQVVETCCGNGWAGFKASWLTKAIGNAYRKPQNITQTAEYRERLQACCRGEGRNEKLADDGVTIIVD